MIKTVKKRRGEKSKRIVSRTSGRVVDDDYTRKLTVKKKSKRREEITYTTEQISYMLNHLTSSDDSKERIRYSSPRYEGIEIFPPQSAANMPSRTKIRLYAKRNNLYVKIKGHFLIPKSNLQKIIDGLSISVTTNDLEKAAHELGYRI